MRMARSKTSPAAPANSAPAPSWMRVSTAGRSNQMVSSATDATTATLARLITRRIKPRIEKIR